MDKFFQSFKKSWPWLLAWVCVDLFVQESIGRALLRVQQHASEMLPWLAGLACLQMLAELILSAIWMLGVVRFFQSKSAPGKTLSAFNQLLIENLRVLSAILYRVPILIVPALVEFLRLAFVGYIVVFDPEYWHGRIDALKRSRELTRRHFWSLGVALSFTGPGWSLIKYLIFSGELNLLEDPIPVLIAEVLGLCVNLLFSFWIYNIYQKSLKNSSDEGIYATGI